MTRYEAAMVFVCAGIAATAVASGRASASTGSLAPSACTSSADPDIWFLKTGGFWKQGSRFGHYRVAVLRRGIEHAVDWAQLQVVESDEKTQQRRVTACFDLQTPGLKGYVRDIRFKKAADKLTAIEIDIEMKDMGDIVLTDVFLISSDGKLTKLVNAKTTDLGD